MRTAELCFFSRKNERAGAQTEASDDEPRVAGESKSRSLERSEKLREASELLHSRLGFEKPEQDPIEHDGKRGSARGRFYATAQKRV